MENSETSNVPAVPVVAVNNENQSTITNANIREFFEENALTPAQTLSNNQSVIKPSASTAYQSPGDIQNNPNPLATTVLEHGNASIFKSKKSIADVLPSNTTVITTSQSTLHPTSAFMTFIAVIKAFIGTGILSLPMAFYYSGIWLGAGITLLIFIIMAHCLHILLNCTASLCIRHSCQALNYGDVAYLCFHYGPEKLKKLGYSMKIAVDSLIAINQCGLLIVYILFIASNLRQIVEYHTSVTIDSRLYELGVTISLMLVSLIRSLRSLTYLSIGANLLMFASHIVIFQYCIRNINSLAGVVAYRFDESMLLTVGMAAFTFGGIASLLPIRNKMAQPVALIGYCGALNQALAVVLILNLAMSILGYLCFGNNILSSITLNLPTEDWLYVITVKIFLAIAVYLSAALQLYFGVNVIWAFLRPRVKLNCFKKIGVFVIRIIVLIIAYGLTIAIPYLDLMISLNGAVFGINIAVVLPPFLELMLIWPANQLGRYKWKLIKNVTLMMVGVFACIAATYLTLSHIVTGSGDPNAAAENATFTNTTNSSWPFLHLPYVNST